MTIPAALRDDLIVLSRAIHADPELAYEERRAVARIAALLEKHGHRVERDLGGLETAFRARVGPARGPAVALLAEYDALPEVGHGCGHNLIAMTNVGAFLLAAQRAKKLGKAIELIGTPAEEKGGGKLDLLDKGVFKDAAAVLSSHPSANEWQVGTTSLGVVVKTIAYRGLASHAAVDPEKGRNALNGVIRLFVGVDGWRQHLPSDARVHGIITSGGAAQNIVPAYAEAEFGLRSKDLGVLREMMRTFDTIARAAAEMTGTTVEITDEMRLFEPTKPDAAITDILADELSKLSVAPTRGELVFVSTDFGNISQRVAADYISFPVATTKIAGHSHAWREAAATDLAHDNALITVEALAAAALRLAA